MFKSFEFVFKGFKEGLPIKDIFKRIYENFKEYFIDSYKNTIYLKYNNIHIKVRVDSKYEFLVIDIHESFGRILIQIYKNNIFIENTANVFSEDMFVVFSRILSLIVV